MCALASMYQSEKVFERGVKQSERENMKSLIQIFWVVTLFQLVRGDLREKNICSIFSIKHKDNGFSMKIGLLSRVH